MARNTHHESYLVRRSTSRCPRQQRLISVQPYRRRPWIEPLEDQRLLAQVTVDTCDDTMDVNDGMTSLREAIFATNQVGGADTIEFAASLSSGGLATVIHHRADCVAESLATGRRASVRPAGLIPASAWQPRIVAKIRHSLAAGSSAFSRD
jgi:hypothetical protein